MTNYVVGSDHSGNGDTQCIEQMCTVFRNNGHTAENIGVTPNLETNLKSKGKGNIGVFMVNGICIGTFDSVCSMVKNGGIDFVWFAIPQSINPSNEFLSCTALQSKKVPIAHDDHFTPEPRRSELNYKYTIAEYCAENSQYVGYACGATCEDVANKILEGGSGGATGGTDSSEDKKEPTPMSYKDMILDLISVWDGDVEAKIKQNKLYINKVPEPKPKLWVVDGVNVVSGQAKVKDYNSDTINTLNVLYDNDEHYITITDEYLIDRFGEVEAILSAEKIVTDYSGDTETGTVTDDGPVNGTAQESKWTAVAGILQKYYEKPTDGWNSRIKKILAATKYDPDIKNTINTLTKKSGYEKTSYVDVGHEICKELGVGF